MVKYGHKIGIVQVRGVMIGEGMGTDRNCFWVHGFIAIKREV